jgi:hypothetical protein
MSLQNRNLVIGIYFHPEAYPPTLNAIGELSDCFKEITVVHRPHAKTEWQYPENVRTVASGSFVTVRQQELASLPVKIGYFATFMKSMLKACREKNPAVILVYDSMSLLAYRLIRPLIPKDHILWYHNHDVSEWQTLRKYSIGWFAGKTEAKAFTYIDIFSLPSNERKQYFPFDSFAGQYFFIPNYPARKFYNRFYKPKTLDSPLRLIFQGSIGPYHGIEEIISFLGETIAGRELELVLKGPCREEVKKEYEDLARKHDVSSKLIFAGVTAYAEVPRTASTCHIGIGILAKNDIMNLTLGTASNKLYEYAAVGLPVVYYNSENFARFLGRFPWAVPAPLSAIGIKEAISKIAANYEQLSVQAHKDFDSSLNFESGFESVKTYLGTLGNKK